MGKTIGIDLGTSNTVVAHMEDGRATVIKGASGAATTQSAVFCDFPHFVVGEVALNSLISEPQQVVQFAKRSIGKSAMLQVGENQYSPEFISSIILKKVVEDAEAALGDTIDGVVITVPAYFGEAQRQATFSAARLAGLNVLRLINEPTAAALSYGVSHRDEPGYVLIYDLGGGTFDVTVLEIAENSLDVVAIGGDPALGGKDFNDALTKHLKKEIAAQLEAKGEVIWDASSDAELSMRAESLKKQLSGRASVAFSIKVRVETPDGERDLPVRFDVKRETFERLISPLLIRTEIIVTEVLARAKLGWDEVRHVLCVGGSSRIPLARDMLERLSGRCPLLHDPDECVAKGAAIQAALITNEAPTDLQQTRVSHVLPRSLGVAAVKNGRPVIDYVLPGLTPLPCAQVRHGYTTSLDFQSAVQVPIYEGESCDIDAYQCGPIGSIRLEIHPPRRKGQPNISVRFQCDANGLIIAEARDLDSGRESRTTITLGGEGRQSLFAHEATLISQAIIS